MLALEPDGDLLHVPIFSYLNGELLAAAVTRGVQDQRVEAYLDSIVKFASPYLERPELVEPLVSSGGYRTTESEVLESFPTPKVSLTREEGLSLVREACLRLKEQVSSLAQRYGATLPGDERDPKAARHPSEIHRPFPPKEQTPQACTMLRHRRERQTKGTAREGPTVSRRSVVEGRQNTRRIHLDTGSRAQARGPRRT